MINRQFSLHRGDTWPGFVLVLTASDPTLDPIDFTGATITSDIREDPNGPRLMTADVATEITESGATVTVSLSATKTAYLQGTVVGDVQVVLFDERVASPLAYQLNVSADATRGSPGGVSSVTYQGRLSSITEAAGPISATISTLPEPIVPSAPSGGSNGPFDSMILKTAGGEEVTITVVKIGGIYNLKVGQPT